MKQFRGGLVFKAHILVYQSTVGSRVIKKKKKKKFHARRLPRGEMIRDLARERERERQADRKKERQTGRQTDRQTETQAEIEIGSCTPSHCALFCIESGWNPGKKAVRQRAAMGGNGRTGVPSS